MWQLKLVTLASTQGIENAFDRPFKEEPIIEFLRGFVKITFNNGNYHCIASNQILTITVIKVSE